MLTLGHKKRLKESHMDGKSIQKIKIISKEICRKHMFLKINKDYTRKLFEYLAADCLHSSKVKSDRHD